MRLSAHAAWKTIVRAVLSASLLTVWGEIACAFADTMELARQKNCLACHAIDRTLLGPAYQDVATRYAGQPDAADKLTAKVLQGGSGVWGAAAMPANNVTEAEARQLVQWVLSFDQGAPATQQPSMAREPAPTTISAPARKVVADDKTLARGKYLVESVMACGNCHSGHPGRFGILDQPLTGGRTYATPAFQVTAGNLTSDPETGLGDWTIDDIKRALTTGVRPNGVPLAPAMPWAFFKALTPQDLDAVANDIATVPPIHKPTPDPLYLKAFQNEIYPDAQEGFTEQEIASDTLARGRYLAALGHCLECHTPEVNGVADFVHDAGRGGKHLGPNKTLVPNITADPQSGLGSWTDTDIKRALTTGVSRNGHRLVFPMPWPYLARLTPDDLDALVVWLRSLPPKPSPL
jgi:cytochrome c551/c552